MALLDVCDLEKSYYIENSRTLERRRIDVIKNVSFEIDENESVAIMGKSGCGKTTLLKMMGGLLSPSNGYISFKGEKLSDFDNERIENYRRRQVGFVFQDYKLLDNMTIKENMILPCILDHQDIAEALGKVEKIAEMLNICDRLEYYPYELSGGEKQRAAVGRALINSPSIIFADEPTGNLDADTSKAVMDMLIGLLHEFKIAMIIVTHDKDIADYCCRTVHIQDGKMY